VSDLTAVEVAADLKLSRWTVLDYLRRGILPGYQAVAGGPWRVQPEALAEWKRTRSQTSHISDPYRIEPRTSRSEAAHNRKASR